MPNRSSIEFWYEFASTYSYPAAMRIEEKAGARGVEIIWRPFLLGPIAFAQQGLKDSIFNAVPVKGRYMWRDLARTCREEGLAFNKPSAFPRNSLRAARVAFLGENGEWTAPFTRAVYEANFVCDEDIADREILGRILAQIGQTPEPILNAAGEKANKDAFRARTDEAMSLGIFGAPSFVVRSGGAPELFWGFDRLDAALDWATAPEAL